MDEFDYERLAELIVERLVRPRRFHSRETAAEEFGVSVGTIDNWLRDGLIRKVDRLTRCVVIPDSELVRLASHLAEPPARQREAA